MLYPILLMAQDQHYIVHPEPSQMIEMTVEEGAPTDPQEALGVIDPEPPANPGREDDRSWRGPVLSGDHRPVRGCFPPPNAAAKPK